jgi:hypothetical protein
MRMLSACAVAADMRGEIRARGDRGSEDQREHRKSAPPSMSPPRLFDERLRVDERLINRRRFDSSGSFFDDRHR